MTPEQYDAWYDTPRGRWIGETEYRLIERQFDLRPGAQILDVGCGTGWFTRRMSRRSDRYVTGLDINAEWLAYARSRDPSSRYVLGDALSLPFPDNSFDSVISIAALCFTADWRQAVGEIVRVCRGQFAIGMLNRQSLLWHDKGRKGGSGAYHGATWVTPKELIGSANRLAVERARQCSVIFFPSGSLFARALEFLTPQHLLYGGFIVMAGRKATTSDEGQRCETG